MNSLGKKEPLLLLGGDVFFFLISLWISLVLRNLSFPSAALFRTHLEPFSLLFIAWIVVFYIAGLYDKHTTILQSRLPGILFNTQIANSVIAVLFFYFIPFFGITPKTLLFIYLIVSFFIILSWRMYGYFLIGQRDPEKAILIGAGEEIKELYEEVNANPLHNLHFVTSVDLTRADKPGFWGEIIERVYAEDISLIVLDLTSQKVDPILPHLYNLIFSKVRFVDMHKIYEDIFDRVPLSLLTYNWFLENISTHPRIAYDALKRVMDILISLPLALVSLIVYPFVYVAVKLDDGGPLFIAQERVGKNNKLIHILKFRTMTDNDNGRYGKGGTSSLHVTRVGAFLRTSRIDELPQLWSVLKGDQSLIGPRPELPQLVKLYEKEIPYYNVRYIIKPGLSGWAQIYQENHPHHGEAVMETREKLAYDLYYIKNRSLWVDIKISLKTIKTLLSRVGK
jgi:exopolysaccharide biosynthesis polyprenyl glycosylphosphotransferase